eukprot:s885_g6.t1
MGDLKFQLLGGGCAAICLGLLIFIIVMLASITVVNEKQQMLGKDDWDETPVTGSKSPGKEGLRQTFVELSLALLVKEIRNGSSRGRIHPCGEAFTASTSYHVMGDDSDIEISGLDKSTKRTIY